MAAPVSSFRVEGVRELIAKLNAPRLIGPPLRRFWSRAAILTQSRIRERTPVDQGPLRNSIAPEIDPATVPRWARVGTNLKYAPAQEFGFPPGRVFPPPAALEPWARRHGFPEGGGYLVARAIFRRGMKPQRYLRDGLDDAKAPITNLLPVLAREIEASAAMGAR